MAFFKTKRPTRSDLNEYCSARFRSKMEDFPEFIKARSKIKVTAFLPEDFNFPQELFENGKKKDILLPPLDTESNLSRQIRADLSEPLPFNESRMKHVTVEVDRKIVTHLKRTFVKRSNRKADTSTENGECTSEDERMANAANLQLKPKDSNEKSIFANYSETGEKILEKGLHKRKNILQTNESQNRIIESKPRLVNGSVPLPAITRNGQENGTVDVLVTELKTQDELVPGRDIETPSIHTPNYVVQENSDISTFDMSHVVNGKMNQVLPPDNTVIPLYIVSGYTDTNPERSYMQEHVFPAIRSLCQQRNKEIRVLDLHWGFDDNISNDHTVLDVQMAAIKEAMTAKLGVNFAILLGQKMGSKSLPREISRMDMEEIVRKANEFNDKQRLILALKAAEIETARAERDKLQQEDSVLSQTDNTNGKERPDEVEPISVKAHRRQSVAARKEKLVLKSIREEEESLPDVDTLLKWYLLDENTDPNVYRLQNISMEYKEILKADASKRAHVKESWISIRNKLHAILVQFAPDSATSDFLKNIQTSDLEKEIQSVCCSPDNLHNTIFLERLFDGTENILHDASASAYIDLETGKQNIVNVELHDRIKDISIVLNDGKIPHANKATLLTEWTQGGIQPLSNRESLVYVDRFSKTMSDMITKQLKIELTKEIGGIFSQNDIANEVAAHIRFGQSRAKEFQGRKSELQKIKSYLESRSIDRAPLFVHGKAGCGKTALLSYVATHLHSWIPSISEEELKIVFRVIGTTQSSNNIRSLLRNICLQLCHILNQDASKIPSDWKGVFNDFFERISSKATRNTIVIIIDGLDNLQDEYEGKKLSWLPIKLPSNVFIILSCLSDDICMASAKRIWGENDCSSLEVPGMMDKDVDAIVKYCMTRDKRALVPDQFDVLMSAVRKNPFALYIQMVCKETQLWTSYMKQDFVKLGETSEKVATLLFGRLERDHGEALIRRALGYIAASRNGISFNEMEDLLSLDDAVMDEVTATYKQNKRRLPTLLWYRVLYDLKQVICEYFTDKIVTVKFSHKQFLKAATDRYLLRRDKAHSYHKALAEYFLNVWHEKPKPFSGNDKGCDRLISNQKLYFEIQHSTEEEALKTYNMRKVNELPFHLMHSQQTVLYKEQCLCNIEWMLAKLCGSSYYELVEEYQVFKVSEPNDPEINMISDVLHLSNKALFSDPRQLTSQIVGRLSGVVAEDAPKAPGDPLKYPFIHKLVAASKESSIPALIPSVECLTQPGGILYDILSGHSEPISALTLTSDGTRAITCSLDGTLKVWNVRTGKVLNSFEGVDKNVSAICTGKNNKLAITVQKSTIKIFNLTNGYCLKIIDNFVDSASICVAAEGQILVAVFDGCNALRSWNLDDLTKLCEADIPGEAIHKDNSILVGATSYGEYVLHAFRGGNTATVQHVRNGKVLKVLKCHDESASVVSLAMSREYFIVCCREQYMSLHEINCLQLFDVKNGAYIRSVRGCIQDNVKNLFVNLVGSHAIAINPSKKKKTSDIALWNLETEDHKHLASHSGISTVAACLDFQYCLSGGTEDNFLRIWNLSSKVNQPAPKLKKQIGVCSILPMIDNPRYVIAKSVNNGPISIWNVAKGKCLQAAVRIERGLSDGSDALIIRNTRIVILTDRGFSNVTDDARPVFQTVLVYDLGLKKYVRKLPSCYIVPAPSHEYVLLENDILLGPSDNRSHFILWNLTNGHPSARIRTNFKELDRRHGVTPVSSVVPKRLSSAQMTPWEKRSETTSAKKRREDQELEREKSRLEEIKKEKDNSIEQFIISGDQSTIVASFYAHHLCVFDVKSCAHTQTLQTEHSMMFLHTAALTNDGSHLVHANYDEESKISFVTLWDCSTGEIKRKLKKETNVSAVAITDDAQRVVIGRAPSEIHVWDPMKTNSLRRAKGYHGFKFNMNSKIFVFENGNKAVVFTEDVSMWDLESGTVLAVFTPDSRIMTCEVILNGSLILLGIYDKPELVILKLMSGKLKPIEETGGVELFGETSGDTTDEEEGEEDQD